MFLRRRDKIDGFHVARPANGVAPGLDFEAVHIRPCVASGAQSMHAWRDGEAVAFVAAWRHYLFYGFGAQYSDPQTLDITAALGLRRFSNLLSSHSLPDTESRLQMEKTPSIV